METDREDVARKLDGLVEELAAIEHQRWSHWQRYLHSKCEKRGDGTLVIPADLVAKWECQIASSYAALSETEKESDREQVRGYLPVITAFVCARLRDSEKS